MNLKKFFAFSYFVLTIVHSFAQSVSQQEVGIPLIRNYSPREYKAYSQNWEVVQDKRGILYFANGDGVLEYDGVYWKLIPIKNNYTVSDIAIDESGTIFTGSSYELGYLSPGDKGGYKYYSLIDKVDKKDRVFTFILNIFITKHGVYFHTNDKVFRYADHKIKTFRIGRPSNCFFVDEQIYIWQKNIGIRQIVGDAIKPVPGGNLFSNLSVHNILSLSKSQWLIICRDAGMYLLEINSKSSKDVKLMPFKTQVDNFIIENRITDATILKNNNLALSTSRAGSVIIDRKGKLVQVLNKNSGLLNETNYGNGQDNQQALWIATDNGITKAEIGSPLSLWSDASGIKGSVMSTIRFNNILYAATWQGVYYLTNTGNSKNIDRVSSMVFKPVPGIESECWDLAIIRNPTTKKEEKLIVATSNGTYEITGNTAKQITKGNCFKVLQPINDLDKLYIGKDDGLHLFSYVNGSFKTEGKLPTFSTKTLCLNEDSRGRVWAGFEFSGVVLIESLDKENDNKPSSEFESKNHIRFFAFDSLRKFPSASSISIIENQNKIFFLTDKGIYSYNESVDQNTPGKISKDVNFSSLFVDNSLYINITRQDKKNNIWLQISSKKYGEKIIGLLYFSKDNKLNFNTIPFKPIPKMEILSIFPEDNGITWFGGDDGLFRFDGNIQFGYDIPFQTLIRKVILEKDSVLFGGNYSIKNVDSTRQNQIVYYQPDSYKPRISYSNNSITFQFSAPSFYDEQSNKFKYFLDGFDKRWSDWTSETKKEYTNLPHGKYKFHVKSKNIFDYESSEAIYEFEILPPWYMTIWAYIFYIIIFVFIIYLTIQFTGNRLRRAKIHLEELVNERTSKIVSQKKEIEKEKEKSDKLLLNILPFKVAEELKSTGSSKAQHYKKVTVMFADFSGFTSITEKMEPQDLISKLDKYFVFFDEVCVRHNIEKIKTVGDSYMCAGGIPISNDTNPVDVMLAALEIQDFIEQELETQKEIKWDIRIGINTGEVIAGVVGKIKFAYDIWGDAVNIASRMESSGKPGKINISGATYELIKDFFVCTYRGKILAKHKGEIDMYFVEGIRKEYSHDDKGLYFNKEFITQYEQILKHKAIDIEEPVKIVFHQVKEYILNILRVELPDNLYYHGVHHTVDVLESAERLAELENINGEDLLLLKTAALFHDIGFLVQYKCNEEESAKLAKKILPQFNYNEDQIERICNMIIATKIPQKPLNLLEEILCDADLDYLGRDDFYKIALTLQREWNEHDMPNTLKQWYVQEHNFLLQHHFFTNAAISIRLKTKKNHLSEIKEVLSH